MNMKEALAAAIKAAAVKAIAAGTIKEGDLPEVLLEVPPQKEFGDFATNFAMQSARGLKCNPRLVAQAVIDNLDCPYVAKAEIAGPGFINFYLKQNWTAELLASIVAAGADYGNLPARGGEKIQLEYVSANPTGPLHVGHGRGAAVGSSLANLLKAAGYDVTREYYINDAGIRSIIWLLRSMPVIWKSLVWMWSSRKTVIMVTTLWKLPNASSRSTAINSCIWMSRNVCTNSVRLP